MGSSGSSRFSDYPEAPTKKITTAGGGKGVTGGSSGQDPCDQAFSTALEDVALSDFYKKHGGVPAVGTEIVIELRTRLVAVTKKGESIGSLPTKYNGLAQCIKAGWKYGGNVRSSAKSPIPKVTVDVAPQ